jgi:hypothetical protein
MTTFFIAFGIFALAVFGLSLGVILNRRPIQGSCGGLNRIDGVDSDCGGACRAADNARDHRCPRRTTQDASDSRADRSFTP